MKKVVQVTVVAKRAGVKFAPGLGIGVLGTNTLSYDVPDNYDTALLAASIESYGKELLDDLVEVQYKVIE